MEITKAKIISIGGRFKPALFLLNNNWILNAHIDDAVRKTESGRFYLDLNYHLINNSPHNNFASEFVGEYNSELINDGTGEVNDIIDLHQHIKNGLIESANFVRPTDTDFQNLVLSKLHIETTYENIIVALTRLAFYR